MLVPPVLLQLVAAVTALAVATPTPAPVRVAVPDLVGMLFSTRAAMQKTVRFGSSETATLFVANDLDPSGGAVSTMAACSTALCVDLRFTSEFEPDPFLLERFTSELPVVSSLMSGSDAAASEMQPVIIGSRPGDDVQVQTWWRFETNVSDPTTQIPTLDVLLHLKQQSQFYARKDQLLVHLVARRWSGTAATTAIESFSLYGNQRLTYETKVVRANHLEISFAITRDAAQRDVVMEDAYPIAEFGANLERVQGAKVNHWVYRESECSQCALALYNCSSYEDFQYESCGYSSSSAGLIVCLRDHFNLTSEWFQSQVKQQQAGFETPISDMLLLCFNELMNDDAAVNGAAETLTAISEREWWNSTRALSCMAKNRCPIGPFGGMFNTSNPGNMVELTNATKYVHIAQIVASTFSGVFELSFNTSDSPSVGLVSRTSIISDNTLERSIVQGLQEAIAIESIDISVHKTFSDASNTWTLTVVFTNVLFPNFASHFQLSSTATTFSETRTMESFSKLRVTDFDASRLAQVDRCAECENHLSQCQLDDKCRESVLPCMISQFEYLNQWLSQASTFVPEFGTTQLDALSAFTSCTENMSSATWNPVRKASLCYAQRRCVTGTDPESDEPTVFKVTNGTQIFVITVDDPDDSSDTVTLSIAHRHETYSYTSPIASLSIFLRSFVLQNSGDVTVSSSVDPVDATKRRVTLTYYNLLDKLPSIDAPSGDISWIQNTSTKAYFEFHNEDRDAHLSLMRLLQLLREKALPLSSIGEQSRHSWVLAPECVRCSARLFTCDAEHVMNRTCHYNSMASPFGRCLQDQLPQSSFALLMNASGSTVIRSNLSYCARKVASALPNTAAIVASAVETNAALGCFAASKCPFGPLDVISSNQTVILEVSSYIHVLRIHAAEFRFTLDFRFGDESMVFARVLIDDTMTKDNLLRTMTSTLSTANVSPIVNALESEAGGSEWTVEIRYNNVLLPSFSVSIGSNSMPAKVAIENMLMKSSPRLSVSPRDHRKISREPQFTITPSCQECERAELSACHHSRFCHTTVLPCFIARLERETTTVTSGSDSVDITDWLHTCASNGTFYNWWAPLQRFLACYARIRCAVSADIESDSDDTNPSDTVLRLHQGEETLFVPTPTDGTGVFALSIAPPTNGSNFVSQQYSFSGNFSDLENMLVYLTMDGASNITAAVGEQRGDGLARMQVTYGDDYIGLLPRLVSPSGSSSTSSSQPRLEFVSSAQSPAPDKVLEWSKLLVVLRNASALSVAEPTCTECEQLFLTECRNSKVCSGEVLTCLHFGILSQTDSGASSVGSDGTVLLDSDQDLLNQVLSCTAGRPSALWAPLRSFLDCYEHAQCSVSEEDSSPSYLRLQRGRVRFTLSASAVGAGADDEASRETLRLSLQSLAENASNISIQAWNSTLLSGNLFQVQVTYDNYYGQIPIIFTSVMQATTATYLQPRLILYASNGQTSSPTKLVSTISRYIYRPECSSVCSASLDVCQKGDSRAALVCREAVVPCLHEKLSVAAAAVSVLPVDLAEILRTCASAKVLDGAKPIADFISCYKNSRCPLSVQSVTRVPTFLEVESGRELLQVSSTPVTLTIRHPPSSSNSVQFAFSGDTSELATFLQEQVMGSQAAVQAQLSTDGTGLLTLIYGGDYFGDLPVITGSGVQSSSRHLSSAVTTLTPNTATPHWDLFASQLTSQVDFIAQNRPSCTTCASTQLDSCSACATVLQCFAQKLSPPISGELHPIADETGVEVTGALYACISSSEAAAVPHLAGFFGCLMEHACQLSSSVPDTRSDNATYIIAHNATYSFTVDSSELPLDVTITAPPEMIPGPTTVTLNQSDSYELFHRTLSDVVNMGGPETSTVVISDTAVSSSSSTAGATRAITITYTNYYGPLPELSGTSIVRGPTNTALAFQSLGGTASWDFFLDIVDSYVQANAASPPTAPAPTPVKVLANDCAQCGAELFGCTLSDISHGYCSYTNATSTFAQCLARDLDAATYQHMVSNGLGSFFNVLSTLFTCYSEIQSNDEAANSARTEPTHDMWYVASEAMACFDAQDCPLGPLANATTANTMVHLESTTAIIAFAINGDGAFQAVFVATYGFRTLTSSTFTDATTDNELQSCIAAILPARAQVIAFMAPRAAQPNAQPPLPAGFDITLEVSKLYFPDVDIQLVVGTDPALAGTSQQTWSAKLVVVDIDSTKIGMSSA